MNSYSFTIDRIHSEMFVHFYVHSQRTRYEQWNAHQSFDKAKQKKYEWSIIAMVMQ